MWEGDSGVCYQNLKSNKLQQDTTETTTTSWTGTRRNQHVRKEKVQMDQGAHRDKRGSGAINQDEGLMPSRRPGTPSFTSSMRGGGGAQRTLKKAEAKAKTYQHVGCLAFSLLTFFASSITIINLRVMLPACWFYMEFYHIPKHGLCLKCSISYRYTTLWFVI